MENFPVAINAISSYSNLYNNTSAYLVGITQINKYTRNGLNGWYTNAAPPSSQYVQFEYPDAYILKSFDIRGTVADSGYEPLENFDIIGSRDSSFSTSYIIYNGTYSNTGKNQTYSVDSNTRAFKHYRVKMNSWHKTNAMDGANLLGFYARGVEPTPNLLKSNGLFYSVKQEYYNNISKNYDPLDGADFSQAFEMTELFKEVTIDGTTFIPVDKFNNFSIVSESEMTSARVNGLQSNNELVVASGDINTSIAHNIDFFNLSSIGNIKLALSIDSGSTWKTWNGIEFANIDCIIPNTSYNDMTTQELEQWNSAKNIINSQGIGVTTFNTLNFNLLNASKIRFAYVLSRPSYSDTVENSQLDWQFDAKGNLRKMTDSECVIDVYERSVKITSSISNELIKANVMV